MGRAEFSDLIEVSGVADPYVETEPNCEVQSGADWYKLALTATFSGKALHGHNSTPSSETITKQTEAYALKYATARIHFNPAERTIPALGEDITERPYTYRDFKGIRSRAGTFFAFDQGLWEPSSRKRAREAALLAASIASHTGSKSDACLLVSKITSDEIDERAVEVANIPVSHMRRDIVTISKASHRVFSCGTIQRGIRWEDNQLLAEKLPAVAAVDWGRITALARFIAEANIQMDALFCVYARELGVPYALVKGCWAYVAYGDFVLSSSEFLGVPDLDVTAFGVPTLASAYEFSADSILRQCYLNLNKLAYEDESPDAAQLLTILEECKMRVKGSVPKRSRWTETEVLAGPSSHSVDDYEASRLVASSATAFNSLAQACALAIKSLPDAQRLARLCATNSKMGRDDFTITDRLTRTVLSNTTWALATEDLATKVNNLNTARIRMTSLKRSTFGFSGALGDRFTVTTAMARHARHIMTTMARRALLADPPELPKFNPFSELRSMIGAHALQEAARSATHSLSLFRKAWVDRYRDWSLMFAENPNRAAKAWALKYGAASVAFDCMDAKTVIAINARFIDGAAPKRSYLYRFARTIYSSIPPLKSAIYANATVLAEELDNELDPDVRFVDIEAFVYSKLIWLAGDFGITPAEVMDREEAEAKALNTGRIPERAMVDNLVVNLTEEELALEARITAEIMSVRVKVSAATFDSVLSTYDTESTANTAARANGYLNFGEAFEALGAGARYDMETEYTRKAVVAICAEAEAFDDGMILG